jgi:hypothetical protein
MYSLISPAKEDCRAINPVHIAASVVFIIFMFLLVFMEFGLKKRALHLN